MYFLESRPFDIFVLGQHAFSARVDGDSSRYGRDIEALSSVTRSWQILCNESQTPVSRVNYTSLLCLQQMKHKLHFL